MAVVFARQSTVYVFASRDITRIQSNTTIETHTFAPEPIILTYYIQKGTCLLKITAPEWGGFSGGKCLFVNISNYLNKLRILVTDDAIEEAFSMVLEACVATSFAFAAVSDTAVLERRLESVSDAFS